MNIILKYMKLIGDRVDAEYQKCVDDEVARQKYDKWAQQADYPKFDDANVISVKRGILNRLKQAELQHNTMDSNKQSAFMEMDQFYRTIS